jgi:glutamine amidotransferase
MGWNQIDVKNDSPLYAGIEAGSFFYFVHSYYVVPEDESLVATTTNYPESFCSSIARESLCATQFHPEKSQQVGLKLLANFAAL